MAEGRSRDEDAAEAPKDEDKEEEEDEEEEDGGKGTLTFEEPSDWGSVLVTKTSGGGGWSGAGSGGWGVVGREWKRGVARGGGGKGEGSSVPSRRMALRDVERKILLNSLLVEGGREKSALSMSWMSSNDLLRLILSLPFFLCFGFF